LALETLPLSGFQFGQPPQIERGRGH